MPFPGFFTQVPAITLHDPLAGFLGAVTDGVVTYTYTDAVKLAGHSCPTVAGAWLMLRSGLRRLYGEEVPERGGIEVHLRHARETGATGVTALIATLVTGAAPETGFAGIGAGHRFSRRGLLHFGAPIDGTIGLRRRDDGRSTVVDINAAVVPPAPEMLELFPRVVSGQGTAEEGARFATLWQARVETMLIRHADDPELVPVREWVA